MSPFHRKAVSLDRRRVLTGLATSALAAPAMLRHASAQGSATEIVFSYVDDLSDATASQIEAFNTANEGRIRVVPRMMSRITDEHRRVLVSELSIASEEIDVLSADVIWTAEFAFNGWVRDLTGRFLAENSPSAFLAPAMRSTQYRNRTWAVPWYTDTGMIYYRRDLLEEAGIEPPESWGALRQAALDVKEQAGVRHGFVFQGAAYEGGVTNALEYIWSAGGRIMTPQQQIFGTLASDATRLNTVSVDSQATANGLATAREMIASGASPETVAEMDEETAENAFLSGNAVFLRSWPNAYARARAGEAALSPDQIGIAPIPPLDAGQPSYGCLGGWNLMISSGSSRVDASWELIRFLTSEETQRKMAEQGSFLPTRHALYEDEALVEAVPVLGLGYDEVRTARTRPSSPVYSDVSSRIAITFNRVLRGELDGSEAAERLSREINIIMRQTAL